MTGDPDFDREVMEQLKIDWIHKTTAARRNAMANFPDLAKMGLSIDDPYEPDPDAPQEWETINRE